MLHSQYHISKKKHELSCIFILLLRIENDLLEIFFPSMPKDVH